MIDESKRWIITAKHQPVIDDRKVQQVAQHVELSPSYLVLMGLSGILAAIALLTNSIPILIGSMIIAPVFLPLLLVAFALVGGKPRLALHGFGTALLGLLVAMLLAMITVWILNTTNILPPETNLLEKPLLNERVRPGWYSVVVAIAAGISGTIAQLQNRLDTLVGTVAAIALVPAIAAAAVAFMSHNPLMGIGGLELLAINISSIIFAGIITLLTMSSKSPRDIQQHEGNGGNTTQDSQPQEQTTRN